MAETQDYGGGIGQDQLDSLGDTPKWSIDDWVNQNVNRQPQQIAYTAPTGLGAGDAGGGSGAFGSNPYAMPRSAYGGPESYLTEGNVPSRGFGSDSGLLSIGETGYRPPTYAQFSPYLMTDPLAQHRALTENYLGPFANQLGMAYPGIRPETVDEFGRVRVLEPDPSFRSNPGGGGWYEPIGPPGPNQLTSGTVGLYARDPQTGIHEYAHAWSFPRMSEGDWENFDNRIDQYLSRPDPENWRLRNELRAGYATQNPLEAYAEIARLSRGNLANIPPELRDFYPWLSDVPVEPLKAPPTPYEIAGPRMGRLEGSWARGALDILSMSPQKLEYIRGLAPAWQAPFVRQAQEALVNVPPEFLRSYGGWPRWLPRPYTAPLGR